MGRVVLQKTQAPSDADRFWSVVLVMGSRVYLRGSKTHTTQALWGATGNDSHLGDVVIHGGVVTFGIVNSV